MSELIGKGTGRKESGYLYYVKWTSDTEYEVHRTKMAQGRKKK